MAPFLNANPPRASPAVNGTEHERHDRKPRGKDNERRQTADFLYRRVFAGDDADGEAGRIYGRFCRFAWQGKRCSLDDLQKGSTKLAARVEFEDVPKVTTRLHDIRRGNPPKDAVKVFAQIDTRLANDNAIGRIFIEGEEGVATTELLAFPGRDRPKAQSYGPFNQEGSLDGILISVGGKDETISLRLQNGETTYSNCERAGPLPATWGSTCRMAAAGQ
jgi:hypothetical protein